MSNKAAITIVGAGVIGFPVAWDLSHFGRKSVAGWLGGRLARKAYLLVNICRLLNIRFNKFFSV